MTFLVFASAAGAAAPAVLPPTSAATAAAAAPVEQVAATAANVVPVERPQAPAPSPEPQPAETPQGASIPDSIRENVVSAVDEPAAASKLTASTRSAARSTASVVDSVSTPTTSVVSAKTGPVDTVVAEIERRAGALDEGVRQNSEAAVEGIRQNFPEAVAEIRRGVAEKITGLSDRVTQRPDGALLPPALPSSQMATATAPLPSAGPLQISGGSAQDGPLSFLEPQPGFFSDWNPIAPGEFTAKFLASGKLGAVEKVGPALDRSGTPSLSAMSGGSGGLGSATPDSRGSTLPDAPLPAPSLPDAVGSDSGGAFFVPFAALLALLALVAPASTRRLREAPDFRAPTPFVCALERPG